ncbi:helix-turn-helix domain-containing protein [Bacillus albus]|uniref:helix-turn-helix domain-containing protein n=1 Tax=Bacillus albus TaxID=2026189 RepID=UPI001F5D3269|nr:helix-turn-helix domain-containing protein [Bacillus albus]
MIKNIVQNTATIRKIHILEALNESNRIIPSDELADQLQCTNRTVKNDISQIKQHLPENWKLLGVSSRGYVLKKNPEDTISRVIAPYLKQSEIYKIIQGIYDDKKYTLVKWAQLLYVDKLTLQKILNEFTKTLNDFELDFNFKTLQLVGEELNIRYFYIVLFYTLQKYKKTTHLHPHLQKKIERIIESYGVEVDLHVLTIIISVFIKRTMDKCFITKEINGDFTFNSNKLRCVESIVLEIEKAYNVKFHQNEKQFLFQSVFLISEGDIKEKGNITNYYCESHKNMYNEYLSLLETISCIFKLDSTIKEGIQHDLYFQLCKIRTLKKHNLSTKYLLDQYKDLYKNNPELKKVYSVIAPLIISCNEKLAKNKLTEDELHYITFNMACNIHLNAKKKKLYCFCLDQRLGKKLYTVS